MMNFLNSHPRISTRGEILNSNEGIYGDFNGDSRDRILLHLKAMFFGVCRLRAAKIMDVQLEELGLDLSDILEALMSPHVLAVYRRNLLSAYISLKIAEQNGLWYSVNQTNAERVRVDPIQLENYVLQARQRWNNNWKSLQHYSWSSWVAYEDLEVQPEAVMAQVFESLGLSYARPITETVKQNPAPLESMIENFHELGLGERIAHGEFVLRMNQMAERVGRRM
jgi:hypothetical protein